MIAPINNSALQAGDVSAIQLCHVAFGSFTTDAFSTRADKCPLLLQ